MPRLSFRTLFALLGLLAVGLPFAARAAAQESPSPSPKLIILGFDGADADLASQWMDEGKLPNLARLRAEGTFAPLRSTIPSQTPVSWSTFATGLSPGRHGIFDFLKRNPADYKPSFAAADIVREPFLFGKNNPLFLGLIGAAAVLLLLFLLLKLFRMRTSRAAIVAGVLAAAAGIGLGIAVHRLLPVDRPAAINRQQGDTFWKILGDAGKRVRVARVPVTFPPKAFEHGTLLTGLGTPDLSGRIGKPFYFTSELFFQPKGGGDFSVEVVELVDNKGRHRDRNQGPAERAVPRKRRLHHHSDDLHRARRSQQPRDSGLGRRPDPEAGGVERLGALSFPFNSLIKVHGIGKFRVLSLQPEVRVYLSPIQFDPEHLPPGFNITTPNDWVRGR